MKAKRTSKLKRARTERAKPRSVQRVVRGQRPVVSELYEIETTTSLVPHSVNRERHGKLSEALLRRKELKKRYNYVSLIKVTETRETIRAAAVP